MAAKKRLTLIERQQKLLEERGFSKAQPASTTSGEAGGRTSPTEVPSAQKREAGPTQQRTLGPSDNFLKRQEALLLKSGRANAARGSRKTASPTGEDDSLNDNDGASVPASTASRQAPSMHPSAGGVSLGLSESTLGAGDDTAYWDFQHRKVERKDLGHKCHECKQPFKLVGEALTERRGARVSMRYHAECFSGFADPRSQARSSHHEGRLAGSQMEAAPAEVTSKMRTSSHFEGGRVASSLAGKSGTAMALGHSGFGSKSSKGKLPERAPGGFTEDQLAAHDQVMKAIAEDTTSAE